MEKLDTLDENNRFQLRAVAQTLFDEMIEKFIVDENETLEPDLDIYNFLLRIYALSLEKTDDENEDEHEDSDNDDGTDYETMAELVLKRMEEDVTLPKPDRNSYFNGEFRRLSSLLICLLLYYEFIVNFVLYIL